MNNYYEIKDGNIYKTEFSEEYMGGHKTLVASLSSKLGQEWLKEMESDNLDSFFACHPAD